MNSSLRLLKTMTIRAGLHRLPVYKLVGLDVVVHHSTLFRAEIHQLDLDVRVYQDAPGGQKKALNFEFLRGSGAEATKTPNGFLCRFRLSFWSFY